MPIQWGKVCQRLLLGFGFLQAAFAEAALTERGQGPNALGGLPFAHRQQAGGRRQLLLQGLPPRRQGC